MAVTIKLKNSVTQDAVPTTTHLPAVGELALNANINSLGIYMRASDNSIVKMAGPGSVTTVAASTTVAGISEYATNAETTTGTSTTRSVTPAGLKAVTDAERTTSNSTYLALAGGTLTGVVAATAGSNSAPSIHFGDTDSGIYGGTNTVSLAAGGIQGLTLNSDAYVQVPTRLSVGAAGPSDDIHIQPSSPSIRFVDTDATSGYAVVGVNNTSGSLTLKSDDSNALANSYMGFEVDGSERARIDSSGQLLLGHSASRDVGGVTGVFQVEGTTTDSSSLSLVRNSANNGTPYLTFAKARGASVGSNTVVQDDDGLGEIRFAGADGTDLASRGASIEAFVDGTPGSNDMPGRLVFSTTADGANAPTERLRITSTGMVKVFGDLYLDNGTNAGKDIHWDESNNYLNFSDDVKAVFGGSNDLQVYHDGHSRIKTSSSAAGNLVIDSNNDINLRVNDSEMAVHCKENGAVELYYNNLKKLQTDDNGIEIHDLDDTTAQAKFISSGGTLGSVYGNSNDSTFGLLNTAGEWIVQGVNNGATNLYYDNSKKFETTSNGATLTGNHLKIDGNNGEKIILTGTANPYIRFHETSTEKFYMQWNSAGYFELYNQETSKALRIGGSGAEVLDNVKFTAGNSQDLQIYHDGTNSYIKDTGTGDLNIAGSIVRLQSSGGETLCRGVENGVFELYYDNSKKFETVATGVQFAQDFRCTNNAGNNTAALQWYKGGDALYFADSIKAKFGTGEDLQIYHDGTNSYLKNITGNIQIISDSFRVKSNTGTEAIIHGDLDAAVKLYFDASKKFETVSTGCELPDDSKLYLGDSGDLALHHDGSNSYIANTTGELFISASQVNIKSAAGEYMAYFNDNGEAALYYDDSKKLETKSDGVGVTGFLVACQNASDSDRATGQYAHVFQTQNGAYNAFIIEHSSNSNPFGLFIDFSDDDPDNSTNYFIKAQDSSANRFFVYSDGDVWNHDDSYTGSDQTLKENIVDATSKLEDLKKLKVRNFNWKSDYFPEKSKKKQIGFIAQEVEQVFPALISEHDIAPGTPEDGHTPVMKKAIKQAWDPIIIKAMQELIEKVETLETKVAALGG